MSRALSGGAYHWREYSIDELLPPASGERAVALLLGCGDAAEKPFLVEAGYRPLGVDVRQMRGGADVIADAHFLPLADACVDLVLSMQVFEHLRAPWLAAGEVARVLRPGGCFIGSVAFLKPYHGSYFHMTHEGVHQLLLQAGLATDRLFGAQSLIYSLYGGMIPVLGRRAKRRVLGSIDRLLFAARTLTWRLTRRKDPNAVSQRFDEDLPLSFRTFDKLRFAPAVVFRARKPVPPPTPTARKHSGSSG